MSVLISFPRTAFITIAIGIAVLGVAFGCYLYFPSAKIIITPPTFERNVTRDILLSTNASAPDFVKFTLPATVIDKTVEERITVQREGTTISEDFSRGVVKITNQQNEEQPLLPKTHLRHEASGVFFLTDTPVRIPPQGSVEVGVTAKEQGKAGNVPPGKFVVDKLPASMQAVVSGESMATFSGGESVDSPLLEQELNQKFDEIIKRAQEKAQAEVSSAAGGAPLRPDLTTYDIEERHSSAEVGSKTTAYEVKVRVRARSFLIDDKELLSLTLLALRALAGADEEFMQYKTDSFKVELLKADFERGEAYARGSLTGVFTKKTPVTAFETDSLVGRTEKEVKEFFSQREDIGEVKVELTPFWVKTVPARKEAVKVEVKSLK